MTRPGAPHGVPMAGVSAARRPDKRPDRAPVPEELAEVTSLAHDGRGVAKIDGKVVFVAGALPGEQVRLQRYKRQRSHDEARVLEVVRAATERVEPRCAHYGTCGGCALQHMEGGAQVAAKQAMLAEELARIGQVTPASWLAPLTAATWGYRRRARLGARFVEKRGRVLVGFREREGSLVTDVSRCEVLDPAVADLPGHLSALFTTMAARERLPQVEVSVGEGRPVLVLRHLVPLTAGDLDKLRAFAAAHAIDWWLQPAGIDSIAPLPPAERRELHYALPAHDIRLAFQPLDFIQVNGPLNEAMVAHALQRLALQPGDEVLDLFCGLGNFTLPIARQAARVHGVEGDAGLVARAEANAASNGLANATFSVANLFEPVAGLPWARRQWDKVLLDPPRAGAREVLPAIAAAKPGRIVYVSCHPGSLARDAGILVHELGYRLLEAGVMDMFPHTGHVESIAVFEPAAG